MPQKTVQVDETNKLISKSNPLDVGDESTKPINDTLQDILAELKLHTMLLEGILK